MQGKDFRALAGAVCLMALTATTAYATHDTPTTRGHTTLEQRVVPPDPNAAGYRQLTLQPVIGGEHVVRENGVGTAQANREDRRTSLAYFAQLSDFQLADEESPLRVEFLDSLASSAFRPWEAMEPHIDDAMIRQINAFADASPTADADGNFREMDYSIDTGDAADSQQLNETQWVRTLYEGDANPATPQRDDLNPNSGVDPASHSSPFCGLPSIASDPPQTATEAAKYTGVQDYDDYDETQVDPSGYFYDPDNPAGSPAFGPTGAGFLQYAGLMDRAQASFEADGLDVPSYIAFGNHDGLVQGTIAGTTMFEKIALGCIKTLIATFPPEQPGDPRKSIFGPFDEADVLRLRDEEPQKTLLVPPDPNRRLVSKQQYKDIFKAGTQDDGHGFDFVEAAQEAASAGNAGYYSFSPVPGVRMIALDTISEAGIFVTGSNGNIDHPQYVWLEGQLQAARQAKELVVLYSHHAPDSFQSPPGTPDEAPGACGAVDEHGHNLGCDIDPRSSTPLHLKDDMIALLHRYPNVIAWAAGHSHENKVQAFPRGDGYGFWVLRVAAEADWPQQARLLELFDNHDGTLSIFGTLVDHASPATAPAADPLDGAALFDSIQLASVARTIAYNDPQSGARCPSAPSCTGEGGPADRNVELLVNDPRLIPIPTDPPAGGTTPTTTPQSVPAGTTCKSKKSKKKGKKKKKKGKKCAG
jgi:hypothetical protein